jgi:hypothetical protein
MVDPDRIRIELHEAGTWLDGTPRAVTATLASPLSQGRVAGAVARRPQRPARRAPWRAACINWYAVAVSWTNDCP